MIEVPASFVAMPRWRSDVAGEAWVWELPSLVDRQCRSWGLSVDGEAMHGSNALVVPVRRSGSMFALRLAPPGDDVLTEAQALRTWVGTEVVQLFDVDESNGALLLERLDGGRTLSGEPLQDAVAVLGALARRLAIPVASTVRSTAEVAHTEGRRFEVDWFLLDRPTPQHQMEVALRAAETLSRAAPGVTAVNGDLHFDQVLAGRRAPWIVVDPVLLRGDIEYDLGRILWSRLDEAVTDDLVEELFTIFTSAADVPPDRAVQWVVVRAMSYLLWGLNHGLTEDPPRCKRLLDIFT